MSDESCNANSLPVWYLIGFANELLKKVDLIENDNLEFARGIFLAVDRYKSGGGELTEIERSALIDLRDTINTLQSDKAKPNNPY